MTTTTLIMMLLLLTLTSASASASASPAFAILSPPSSSSAASTTFLITNEIDCGAASRWGLIFPATRTITAHSPLSALSASDCASTIVMASKRDDGKTGGEEGERGSGPAILDRPETVKEQKTDESTKSKETSKGSEGWEVRLFNDPMNKREFVARCLTEICGMSDTQSYQVMMQAHQFGLAVIGRYHFERAELYHNRLRDQGLFVDMRPVDDE